MATKIDQQLSLKALINLNKMINDYIQVIKYHYLKEEDNH